MQGGVHQLGYLHWTMLGLQEHVELMGPEGKMKLHSYMFRLGCVRQTTCTRLQTVAFFVGGEGVQGRLVASSAGM